MARMTGWHRIIQWQERTPVGRVKALGLPFIAPVRAFKRARTVTAMYGRRAQGAGAGPEWRQVLENSWLMTWYGLGPTDYYRFRLYLPHRWRNASTYLTDAVRYQVPMWVIRRFARAEIRPLQFKRLLDPWCRVHGIPTAIHICEFADGQMVSRLEGSLPDEDLFSKNADGSGGAATTRWFSLGSGRFRDASGRTYDETGLLARLADESRTTSLLLQVALQNAPEIADLSPRGALCTVRVVTMRRHGGVPEPVYALIRMPVGDMVVDNTGQGGMGAMVDITSGVLGFGAFAAIDRAWEQHDTHPDTGARVRGRVLPRWTAVIELALRAHEAVGPVPAVGWDIPITTHGPLLLEGNPNPAHGTSQATAEMGLEWSVYPRYMNEYVEWAFARRLKPITVDGQTFCS